MLAIPSGCMAGHFAKGNAAAKETIDRISGSGVFARDPDSLITFTKHEEQGSQGSHLTIKQLTRVKEEIRLAVVARPLRIERAGGWYHVTARGNERKPIF